MAQQMPRCCPYCGEAVAPQQRICASCGMNLTTRISGAQRPTLQQQTYQPAPVKTSFQPHRNQVPRRGVVRVGCVLVLFLLLIVLGVAYIGAPQFGLHIPSLGLHIPSLGKPSQPPITTVSLNTTVVYAGISVTIVHVQRADSFLDDTTTNSPGVLRLQVRAENNTQVPTNLLYTTSASLVVPGEGTLMPTFVNADVGLPAGVTRTSVIDFAVATDIRLDQLIFRLGTSNEAQIDIPLTVHPDLTQYDPKTTTLSGQMHYRGLDWTLTSATTQLSIDGTQAAKGMHYITVQLKVNNILSQIVIIGSAFDYVRLQVGDTTFTPIATTLPVAFPVGASGQTGSVMFLVPQSATTLTFILIASDQSGFSQATATIQLS